MWPEITKGTITMLMKTMSFLALHGFVTGAVLMPLCLSGAAFGQASATLGNGMSAGAIARGGITVEESGSPVDAIEGNPAGLAGSAKSTLEFGAVGLEDFGSFSNVANNDAKLRGVAGAMPFGAFVTPLGKSPWRAAVGVTPEILMRANWHYFDAPGTLGVSYGYQTQETQIIAVRSSLGVARSFGEHWSVGATVGIIYNENDLHAPYIFQQQPQLAGLKVLLGLTTHGYGWHGRAERASGRRAMRTGPPLHCSMLWE
jgi:long-chain fatty acid transport protein